MPHRSSSPPGPEEPSTRPFRRRAACPLGLYLFDRLANAAVFTNLTQAIDHRGPNTTTLTLTPGFRVHLRANWYGLGGVELPVTQPQPFDYQVLGGLMKVW